VLINISSSIEIGYDQPASNNQLGIRPERDPAVKDAISNFSRYYKSLSIPSPQRNVNHLIS